MKLQWTYLTSEIHPLVTSFESENPSMARYLVDPRFALIDAKTGETRTFLFFTEETPPRLAGYVSIKCASLKVEFPNGEIVEESGLIPPNLEIYPSVEIVMLARDKRYERQKVGEDILYFIIDFINEELRPKIGIRAITLFAVPEKVSYYSRKFQFRNLDDGMQMYDSPLCSGCIPMFLALPSQDL